jgi:hypothetical protein
MHINQILLCLAATASRLEKEAILRKNAQNNSLKEVFKLALDPLTNFYIRKIPAYTRSTTETNSLEFTLGQLYRFSSRELTGNAAIDALRNLLSMLEPHDALVIEKIIQRDLRCGVSEATANKIWEGLVPEYPVMLASGFDQKLVQKIKWPAVVQHKLDGMRFNAIIKGGKVEFRTRNGKLIEGLKGLEAEFLSLNTVGYPDLVYDGELLVKESGKILDRKTGNGILNKAVKGTISGAEASMVCATLWDIIPYDEFLKEKTTDTYKVRLAILEGLQFSDKISLVESTYVNNITEATVLFEKYLAQGHEGTILKNLDSPWEAKRAKHQIKFKGELECDLRCVDWEEGTGKNVGRLGALVLESDDAVIRVSVGTGFSDADRANLTREKVIDKIIAVKYNARIQDKNNVQESLFLPVFLEVRLDKTTADNSKTIK